MGSLAATTGPAGAGPTGTNAAPPLPFRVAPHVATADELAAANAQVGPAGLHYPPAEKAIAAIQQAKSVSISAQGRVPIWVSHPDERVQLALFAHPTLLAAGRSSRTSSAIADGLYIQGMRRAVSEGIPWNPTLDQLCARRLWPAVPVDPSVAIVCPVTTATPPRLPPWAAAQRYVDWDHAFPDPSPFACWVEAQTEWAQLRPVLALAAQEPRQLALRQAPRACFTEAALEEILTHAPDVASALVERKDLPPVLLNRLWDWALDQITSTEGVPTADGNQILVAFQRRERQPTDFEADRLLTALEREDGARGHLLWALAGFAKDLAAPALTRLAAVATGPQEEYVATTIAVLPQADAPLLASLLDRWKSPTLQAKIAKRHTVYADPEVTARLCRSTAPAVLSESLLYAPAEHFRRVFRHAVVSMPTVALSAAELRWADVRQTLRPTDLHPLLAAGTTQDVRLRTMALLAELDTVVPHRAGRPRQRTTR